MAHNMPELLAPAGGPAQFNAALAAGADAIYCGFGNTFNARRGAQSFDSTTFGKACRSAHIAGARVYVTVNVAVRDDEMPTVLALVRRVWLLGADAFIIQDWGLLNEVRRRWPDIECHVSTQANVHDSRAVAWCKSLGVDRVTLSRELSLAEVSQISRVGVDLECFCHGAICICYSGVCHMSSCAGGRSANRGACAQPCRLPYELVDKDGKVLSAPDRGRPLCPRDFYSFDDLEAMAQAGVASLKVEGRLKGPDYIVSVISAYREQMDDLAAGLSPSVSDLEERRTRLKRAFNRDFTNAYLKGTSGDELMSYERSNNRGEVVGVAVDSQSFGTVKVRRGGHGGGRERLRTLHVAQTTVLLNKPVHRGDLLEIRPTSDPSQFLTAHVQEGAAAGERIVCKTTRAMEPGSVVRVIRSQRAMDQGAHAAEQEIARRRKVQVRIRARIGQPFGVEMATVDGAACASARGFVVEPARSRPVTSQDLIEHVGRMGNTAFEPVSFEVEADEGCGMGFSAVHKVRAQACEALEQQILAPYAARELSPAPSRAAVVRECVELVAKPAHGGATPAHRYTGVAPRRTGFKAEVCALVSTPQVASAARDAGATRIYASSDDLSLGTWPKWVVPLLDEVCRNRDHARLDPWVQEGRPVAVGNVSELVLAAQRNALAELRPCIPVHNRSCLAALYQAGARGAWLSPELSLDEIRLLAQDSPLPLGLVVVGRVRAMTCEHCVLQVADKCIHDCDKCRLRKQELYLRNGEGTRFPVHTDLQGRSRVYASQVLDLTPYTQELADAGIARLAVDCTHIPASEGIQAIRVLSEALRSRDTPQAIAWGKQETTLGHLLSPIG